MVAALYRVSVAVIISGGIVCLNVDVMYYELRKRAAFLASLILLPLAP